VDEIISPTLARKLQMYFVAREALINSGLMKQPFKMREFKANIVNNRTAIAKIFNAEIACFGC